MGKDILDKQFEAHDGDGFIAEVIFTKISVDSHSSDTVSLHLERSVYDKFSQYEQEIYSDHKISLEETSKGIVFKVDIDSSTMRGWQRKYGQIPLKSELTVWIPDYYHVDLATVSGALQIGHVGSAVEIASVSGSVQIKKSDGAVQATTVSGKIQLEEAQSNVKLTSVSGRLSLGPVGGHADLTSVSGRCEASEVGGNLEVETVSGAILVDRVVGNVEAETVSGRIQVSYAGEAVSLESVSGRLSLGLPADEGYEFDLSTASGKITTDFQVNGTQSRRHVKGLVNSGSTPVSLETMSGSLDVSAVY